MRIVPIALVLCLFLALSTRAAETVRPWADQKGAIQRATLVGYHEGIAFLRPEDNPEKIVQIKYELLSYEDQDYIDRRKATLPGAPAVAGAAVDTQDRVWTSVDGKTVTAKLVNVDGTFAVLERDGRVFRVPIFNLSAADQTYIKNRVTSSEDAMTEQPATVAGVDPKRAWKFKDGTSEEMILVGFRAVDQSVMFNKGGRPFYVAFGDLTPEHQVLAYRWMEAKGGIDISTLTPEGDLDAPATPTTAKPAIPGMPVLPPIPTRTEWTRAADGLTMPATFVRVNGYFVELEREGKVAAVPIYMLSIPDQEYLATWHGYAGPIGNDKPSPSDGMGVSLSAGWGVTPGEMVRVSLLTPEQKAAMFPAGKIRPAPPKSTGAGSDATLGDSGEPFADGGSLFDDPGVVAATVTVPDPAVVEEAKSTTMALLGVLAILLLSALGAYAMCIWIALIARKDGLVWTLICLMFGVLGTAIYIKQNPKDTKIPAVILAICTGVFVVMLIISKLMI